MVDHDLKKAQGMKHHGRGKRRGRRYSQQTRNSLDSNAFANEMFFEPHEISTQSYTWKSSQAKEREQYERKRNLVKHIAPEQFQAYAKPTNAPCNIVPQTFDEWLKHQAEMKEMEVAELVRNIEVKQQRGAEGRKLIKSVFDPESTTVNDPYSAVLARPTIWSPHFALLARPTAEWPCQAELHWDGDSRENPHAQTRCGRFLPPTRVPDPYILEFDHRPILLQLPLDETGPRYTYAMYGNHDLQPAVIQEENQLMDHDPHFEVTGNSYIGTDLMQIIGRWQEPLIPEWLIHTRDTANADQDMEMFNYPAIQLEHGYVLP